MTIIAIECNGFCKKDMVDLVGDKELYLESIELALEKTNCRCCAAHILKSIVLRVYRRCC